MCTTNYGLYDATFNPSLITIVKPIQRFNDTSPSNYQSIKVLSLKCSTKMSFKVDIHYSALRTALSGTWFLFFVLNLFVSNSLRFNNPSIQPTSNYILIV